MQVICEQSLGAVQHSVQVVLADQPVEMHGQLVVIQPVLHDVIPVLQEDGQAQEKHEGVPFAKFLGGRQGNWGLLVFFLRDAPNLALRGSRGACLVGEGGGR